MSKARHEIDSLEEFLHDELGYKGKKLSKATEEIISSVEEIIEEDDVFESTHARDLIWDYTNFSPYIDPGSSTMKNIQNKLVDNFMIGIFMQCLYNELNQDYYQYNKKKMEIKLRSGEKEKL